MQTAGIIANGTGINPAVDERLKEREMGRLNNVKFDSREMMLKAFWDEVESDYAEGLESWDSLKKRISGFMGGLSEGKVFLAVSHRDVIAAALGSVDARFDSDISADVLSIPTASISVIDLEAKEILSIGSDKIPAQLWG
ncbi:MAG: histidine phosphatase family protein [Candidatus Micrarchaeota archaeon]|nr:histidine phosphatase family protein [Candidatus Micrarchaeota archaeon]